MPYIDIPPIPPAWWQQIADQAGESILVMPGRNPSSYAEGPSSPYAVALSQADAWEREHYLERLDPSPEFT